MSDRSFKYKGYFAEIKKHSKWGDRWSCSVFSGDDNSERNYLMGIKGLLPLKKSIETSKNYIDRLTENGGINKLKLDLEQLKFALSNTMGDPINKIHIEGQIRTIEDKIKKIKSGEFKEQIVTDFSPPQHERETYNRLMKNIREDKLKGGRADNMSLKSVEKKVGGKNLSKEFKMGVKDEKEHTDDKEIAGEITKDHLVKNPKYYTKEKEIETKESMGADASGSFEAPLSDDLVRREIHKFHNFKSKKVEATEATDASSSGQYDVAFGAGKGRKDPLKIDGVKSIAQSRAVKDKNFPKWGGPDSVFIKIKESCKKFPYCNQGDINAIEPLREAITETAKNIGIPRSDMEKIVLNELKEIFINNGHK